MTREQWKERLPIITAYANGAGVQIKGPCAWEDLTTTPSFDSPACDYRIKPRAVEVTREKLAEVYGKVFIGGAGFAEKSFYFNAVCRAMGLED